MGFVEQCVNCRIKEIVAHYGKKVVSFHIETCMKGGKLTRQTLKHQTNTRQTLKGPDKIISNFLSEYTRKHDVVSGNPIQRTLLTLGRLRH